MKMPLPNFDENNDITQSNSSILNVNVKINDHNSDEMYRNGTKWYGEQFRYQSNPRFSRSSVYRTSK
ncbi:hypothetical protein BpHYR1_010679 [Brachionus plicatilis]|uniref:Uncharacterized protein n=1 Tax=Brachionus plicatilis TaxID=10195 RepID=A0A3M7T2K7_BRAPC|nr:hypothetical protein BpHYR1_010679 [Brachionus plicatilis]